MADDPQRLAQDFRDTFERLRGEMGKVLVGQQDIIHSVLTAFFAEGHTLLEGAPGLGKTALVRTLGEATGLKFSRVQFTPDLMPADIVGTNLIVEDEQGRKKFEFEPGPIFANLVLADEVNRATPKTQSALLEAMQERQVTLLGQTHRMAEPFLVLATQNPLEMEGTYPLPEAQLDRFLLKLQIDYPSSDDLHAILDRTTGTTGASVEPVSLGDWSRWRGLIREVPIAKEVQERAVQLVLGTHPEQSIAGPQAKKFVRYGASPRGAQSLILCAKISALLDGRFHVSKTDIDRWALPALRHRLILNFEGEAEGITADQIVAEALAA